MLAGVLAGVAGMLAGVLAGVLARMAEVLAGVTEMLAGVAGMMVGVLAEMLAWLWQGVPGSEMSILQYQIIVRQSVVRHHTKNDATRQRGRR